MGGAQLASRVLYPRLGPRRHITLGLAGTSASIGLLALLGPQTSLWWARLLMVTLGLSIAQVFVPGPGGLLRHHQSGGDRPGLYDVQTRCGSSAGPSAWPC